MRNKREKNCEETRIGPLPVVRSCTAVVLGCFKLVGKACKLVRDSGQCVRSTGWLIVNIGPIAAQLIWKS